MIFYRFKKILLAAAISISVSGCVSTETYKPVELTNFIEVQDMDQKVLFNKTRQWFSEYFVSGESVIDYEDKEAGTIIGNGIADVGSEAFGIIQHGIHFTLRVDTKDGKLRVLTKIIKHTNSDSTNGTYDAVYVAEDRIVKAKVEIDLLVKSLENHIQKQTNSDW